MASKPISPDDNDVLTASCYMKGRTAMHDAHFVLLSDNTVRVLIHEGGFSARDGVISVRQAKRARDNLLQKGWKLVSQPRRTIEEMRSDINVACRKFAAKRSFREPDPDANLVPPARQLQRQREHLYLPSAASTRGARVLPGGAFETKKRRH